MKEECKTYSDLDQTPDTPLELDVMWDLPCLCFCCAQYFFPRISEEKKTFEKLSFQVLSTFFSKNKYSVFGLNCYLWKEKTLFLKMKTLEYELHNRIDFHVGQDGSAEVLCDFLVN